MIHLPHSSPFQPTKVRMNCIHSSTVFRTTILHMERRATGNFESTFLHEYDENNTKYSEQKIKFCTKYLIKNKFSI